MTDYSRDRSGDEDRLPWLEPVEEEYEEGGVSTGRLLLWSGVALFVLAMAIGGFLWMRGNDGASSGDGALIEAPDSYYKERPAEDAAPAGDDEIVYSASKGNEVESVIDTSGTAETPVNVDRAPAETAMVTPPPAAKPAPAAARTVTPPAVTAAAPPKPAAEPVAAKPAPVADRPPASGGSTIQIGAFSSEGKARSAWKTLSARFSFLAGLSESIVPVQSGDKTLYRLRASGGNAGDICGRLRTAGESCSVVG